MYVDNLHLAGDPARLSLPSYIVGYVPSMVFYSHCHAVLVLSPVRAKQFQIFDALVHLYKTEFAGHQRVHMFSQRIIEVARSPPGVRSAAMAVLHHGMLSSTGTTPPPASCCFVAARVSPATPFPRVLALMSVSVCRVSFRPLVGFLPATMDL